MKHALLFVLGLATTALPILAFRWLPTQDGGAHYNTAMALADLGSGRHTLLSQIFVRRSIPLSNQLSSQIMAWAAELGWAGYAERMVWLLIFVGFAAAVVGNLWLMKREAAFALLLFPIFDGVLVNLGFINYVIGLLLFVQSAFLLEIGTRNPSIVWISGLGALAAATYLAHPLAGLALAAIAGPFAASYLVRWHRASGLRRDPSFSPLVPLGCAFAAAIPASLAVQEAFPQIVRFFRTTASSVSGAAPAPAPFSSPDTLHDRILDLAGLGFVSYSPADYLFALGFALVILWLGGRWLRARVWDDWLASIATLLILAIIVPRSFEQFLPERLLACLLAITVIWLASVPLDRRAAWRLFAAGLLLNGAFLLWRLQWSADIETVLTEYASVAPAIPDDSTLLSIRTAPTYLQLNCRAIRKRELPCNFKPTLDFVGEIIADRDVALLSNYQLRPQAGFFPIALRPPWNFYERFNVAFEHWPPPPELGLLPDLVALVERTPPDVIVTWDERRATGAAEDTMSSAASPLLQHYTRVFTSQPLGAGAVYVRRPAR